MIKLFNTLSGRVEPFSPIEDMHVGLYTCGPTVYDYAHIGNFRAYVFEDLLKRFLLFMGYHVLHVMNITDIDDKTIKGASAQGASIQEYTQKYIDAFFLDIDTLKILRADHYPKATAHIKEMARMIEGLLQKGYAYKQDGSIYYNISKFPDYGKLSKIDRTQLRKGSRMEADDYEKADAVDFVLWKKKKEGEPSWDMGFGKGRPGWHIECSAMSSRYLGETFDIHCGGVDNIFPHHENEIAQSEAYSGKKFVNYWLHCHHLIVNGQKMSKSMGNFYTLRDLLDKGYDPLAIRFLLLSTHYRKQLNFTFEALKQAASSLQRIKDFQLALLDLQQIPGENPKVRDLIEDATARMTAGLSNDLNISMAITSVFDLIKKANILINRNEICRKDAEHLLFALKRMDQILGILPDKDSGPLSVIIKEKIALREKARRNKDYSLADRIRGELAAQGIILEDTKDGVRWKKTSSLPSKKDS